MGSVQRELKLLEHSGLLTRTRRGNQVYFRANREHPLYADLTQIVRKTSGAFAELQKALKPLRSRIVCAFVFGSFASGSENSKSDIDVFVIGDAEFPDVVAALEKAGPRLDREVNPVVYPMREFRRKLRENNHFLVTVASGRKVFLIGDEREFARVVSTRLDRSA